MAGRASLHDAARTAPLAAARDGSHRDGDPCRDRGPRLVDDVLEAVLSVDEDEGDEVVRRIADVRLRTRCDVEGEIASVGRATGPTVAIDVVLSDGSGHLLCHCLGRDAIPGVTVGARLRVAGRLVTHRSRRCLLNPAYEFVGGASSVASSGGDSS